MNALLRSVAAARWVQQPPSWLKGAIVGAALLATLHLLEALFPVRPVDVAIPPPNLQRLLLTTLYVILEGAVVGGVFGLQRARATARGLSADMLAGVVAVLTWGVISILFGVRHARFDYGVLFLLAAAIAGAFLGVVVWVARRPFHP